MDTKGKSAYSLGYELGLKLSPLIDKKVLPSTSHLSYEQLLLIIASDPQAAKKCEKIIKEMQSQAGRLEDM